VLSKNAKHDGKYDVVDGHGRIDEARRGKLKEIRALVYPRLTLEQRICLREILNAAQEPFDTPLVLRDLQLLAKERGLDVRNEKDLHVLLADLPASVRKLEGRLKLLAKWPSDVANKVSIDDDALAGVIGIDKLKELDSLVSTVRKYHPAVAANYAGDELYRQVLRLYFGGAFRDGAGRSQDTIRVARRLMKDLPQDHASVKKFLNANSAFSEFASDAESNIREAEELSVLELCKRLNSVLTEVDAHNLTAVDRRALKRTAELVSQVLSEIA
jgi:hypothetical protein